MGNTKKSTRPQKKNQPQQLLGSGESEGIGNSSGGGKQTVDTIRLVKLDLQVFNRIKKNDNVILILESDRYVCLFNNQRLGDVPRYYNDRLLPTARYTAVIVELMQNPVSVTVELN